MIHSKTINKYSVLLTHLSKRKRIGSMAPVLGKHKICMGAQLIMKEMGFLTKTKKGYQWTGPKDPTNTDAQNVIERLNRRIMSQAKTIAKKSVKKTMQTFAGETKVPAAFVARLKRDKENLQKRVVKIDQTLAALESFAGK